MNYPPYHHEASHPVYPPQSFCPDTYYDEPPSSDRRYDASRAPAPAPQQPQLHAGLRNCFADCADVRGSPNEVKDDSGDKQKPAISGCVLYENDCNLPRNICKACPDICVNDYWYELNNRLTCNPHVFDRWKSIYQMTTDQVGKQLLEKKADCRRKAFFPRRCRLCDTTDDIYITEQLCKQYVKPVCQELTCYGDYACDPEPSKIPPTMVVTTPRHCAKHRSTECFKKDNYNPLAHIQRELSRTTRSCHQHPRYYPSTSNHCEPELFSSYR